MSGDADGAPPAAQPAPTRPIGMGTLQRILVAERSRSARVLIAIGVVAGIAVAVMGALLWRGSHARAEELTELAHLQDQLREQEQAVAESGELRRKLGDLESRLAAQAGQPDWSAMAKRHEPSIFLCLGIDTPGNRATMGTGFVIDAGARIIATNAHVAKEMAAMPERRAVQSGSGMVFEIAATFIHPGWNDGKGPDLALLRLAAEPPAQLAALEILPDSGLLALGPGVQVGSLGFPGELSSRYLVVDGDKRMRDAVPTFKVGWIGRTTALGGAQASPEESTLIQHSASLSRGTSGSPLFDASGKVVAVTYGGVGMRSSSVAGEMSAAQIGFAVRADELVLLRKVSGW